MSDQHRDNEPNNGAGGIDQAVATMVAESDADVILYNGDISPQGDRPLIGEIRQRKLDGQLRKNVVFILITRGGSADSAYRIARALQNEYEKFTLYVSGYCKSAGTLIALGANQIAMSDHAELGPLDAQLTKKDELWEGQSGLTVMSALQNLQAQAYSAFENFLMETKQKSGGSISLRLATQIATNLTSGLLAPVYSQIDPVHIGEAGRALAIAKHYGLRLTQSSGIAGPNEVEYLTSRYPSHSFVIDRGEARRLFKHVREPTAAEEDLITQVGDPVLIPVDSPDGPTISFLSDSIPEEETSAQDESSNENASTGTYDERELSEEQAPEAVDAAGDNSVRVRQLDQPDQKSKRNHAGSESKGTEDEQTKESPNSSAES